MKLSREVLARRVFSRAINNGLIGATIMGQLGPFISKDRVVADVGAATGHFTDYFASRCARVHAFEAVPAVFMQLLKKQSEFQNVTANNLAVSNFFGKAKFYVDDKRLSNSSFLNLVDGPSTQVNVISLDKYFGTAPPVGFIKIDVEGTELDVITGADEIIRRDKPNMLVEIYEPYSAHPLDAIFEILMIGHEYLCFYFDKNAHPNLVPVKTVAEGVEAVETKHNLHDGDFLFIAKDYYA